MQIQYMSVLKQLLLSTLMKKKKSSALKPFVLLKNQFCDRFIHGKRCTRNVSTNIRQIYHIQHTLYGAVFPRRAVKCRKDHIDCVAY